MKTIIKTILALVFIVTITGIYAQAPQKIDYQAIARESDGQPIEQQNISVQLSILRGPLPGIMVYQERHNPNTDRFGLFTLGIGTGNVQSGSFSGIDWSAGQHFIQIELDKNGGTTWVNMGTVELMSVPYALYAERSGTSDKPDHEWAETYLRFEKPDGSWGTYVDLQGEQGTQGPAGQDGTGVNIIGSVPTAAHLDPSYSGDVGDMFITEDTGAGHVWNGTEWIEVGQIQGPEGPQGIQGEQGPQGLSGTTSWTGLTDIPAGFADNTDNVDDADANTNNEKITSITLDAGNVLSISEPGNTKTVDLSGLAGGSSLWTEGTSNRIYYNDGNVGIGVSNPEAKLAVGGIGDNRHAIHGESSENNGVGIHGEVSGLNGVGGSFKSTNGIGVIVNGYTHDIYAIGSGNNYFAGKVGIGTPYPNAKLAVGGIGLNGDAIHAETEQNYGAGIYGKGTGADGYGGYFISTAGRGIYVEGDTYDVYAGSVSGQSLFRGDVEIQGELNSENTGAANMMPFAYGRISSSGSVLVSTGNITCEKTGTGLYNVAIPSLGGNTGYIVSATANNSSYNISIDPKSGNFDVYSRSVTTGSYGDSPFYLIVYKK